MKKTYEAPQIEVLDVAIEQGIATTGTPNPGFGGFGNPGDEIPL